MTERLGMVLLAAGLASATHGALQVERMRCEYLDEPLAVHERAPRLTWTLASAENGARQCAYRILVASTTNALARGEGDLWDSGKVFSEESVNVPYAGTRLASRQDCWWKVQVWQAGAGASPAGESAVGHWRMGLLRAEDWHGAQWIAAPVDPADLTTPHNGFHSDLVDAQAEQWVQIDLGSVRAVSGVRLHPSRPYDYIRDEPGYLFPLRYKVLVATQADLSDAAVVVDRTAADVPGPGTAAVEHAFASRPVRYVRILATKLRAQNRNQFAFTLAECEVLSGSDNIALGAGVTASGATVSGGWSPDRLVDGRTLPQRAASQQPRPATRFRKVFTVAGNAARAHVAVTGLGTYALYVNGRRVNENLLDPGWTVYRRHLYYDVHDVTALLRPGTNVIAAEVAPGWNFSPMMVGAGTATGARNVGAHRLLAALDVETADGMQRVVTDASWQASSEGPVREAEIYRGMLYDGTREQPGWNADARDFGWPAARVLAPAGEASFAGRLLGATLEPIRVAEAIPARRVTEPAEHRYVIDFGQNMAGICEISATAQKGANVRVAFGEMLNPDGTLYRTNLRGAGQQFDIVWPGGTRTLRPDHTYFGFRYVEVTGLSEAPRMTALPAFSAARVVGSFTSSNPMLNQLMKNIAWTQCGNMHSIGTDCPQRDERLGWAADLMIFSPTAIFNRDMAAFYSKFVQDMVDDQRDDGCYPEFSPSCPAFYGAPGWGDAGVVMPWIVYTHYQDPRILARAYEPAKRWVAYIRAHAPEHVWATGRGHDFGEWLNGDTQVLDGYPRGISEMPKEAFATAYYARSVDIVARSARVLGFNEEAEDYERLFADIAAAFRAKYMNPDGTFKHETQASYALALSFGLATPEMRPRMVERLLACIQAYGNHLSTGIHASHRAMMELSASGHHDEANRLLNLRTVPSWGYMIDQGATTVWERWDGYVSGRGFQNPSMNSFNHWAIGAVGEWVWRTLVGLNLDEQAPGFRHVVIRPLPDRRTPQVDAAYESVRGRIRVKGDLKPETGDYALDVELPPGVTATVVMPTDGSVAEVGSGRHRFTGRIASRSAPPATVPGPGGRTASAGR